MKSVSQQSPTSYRISRAELAAVWAAALVRVCRQRPAPQELVPALADLVEHLLQVAAGEPFHPASAQEIGARLVELGWGQSQSLAQSQRILWRHLPHLLPPERRPRLGALLAEVAAGFTDQMRRRLLRHQEEIRDRLLVARKEAEAALLAERDFVNAILDTVDALILVTDARGYILRFNRTCEQVSGYRATEVEGKHAEFLIPDEVLPALHHLGSAATKEAAPALPLHFENPWRTRTGAFRQISWSLTALYAEDGQIANYIGTGLDVTEQREVEAELKLARRQLALAEEAERVRLAQDLHDDAVQQLLGLSYQLAEMQARAADDAEWTAAQRLEEVIPGLEVMRRELVAVAQGLRRLIGELRPPELRDIGLGEALELFLQGPEWAHGESLPAVHLRLPPDFDGDLAQTARDCLFRVTQEALWNARKHAGAGQITVSAGKKQGSVWLRVRDNGRGFEVPRHLHRFAVHQRFGLLGMQERVAAEGGDLLVSSLPGKGTDVQVRLPLDRRGDDGAADSRLAG